MGTPREGGFKYVDYLVMSFKAKSPAIINDDGACMAYVDPYMIN